MAKLYFRYSTMGAGKTLDLIRVAKNYEDWGRKVLAIKPALDTRSKDIVSRAGVSIPAMSIAPDFPIDQHVHIEYIKREAPACILVDEAQFLTPAQVDQLAKIADYLDIPVICYGLRLDYRGETFPGSARLLAIADRIEESQLPLPEGRGLW